jgi:tRNA A37 threonylcarbamoyladenosine dehydratase
MDNRAFDRNELLLGRAGVELLAKARVILFGVGGVGSWCAEALVRSGVGHLVVVDNDVVCETNINRQLQATFPNLGRSKVTALKERLLQINPQVQVDAVAQLYNLESSTGFDLGSYDYVIDAIDSLSHKVGLMPKRWNRGRRFFRPWERRVNWIPLGFVRPRFGRHRVASWRGWFASDCAAEGWRAIAFASIPKS